MQTKPFSEQQIQKVTEFHGHWCPGLAIGVRAAELALAEVGSANDEEIVAVVESDFCGVDAIQFFCSCTFGKGNLIHRDYGKMAFSFFRRRDNKAIRFMLNPQILEEDQPDRAEQVRRRRLAGKLTQEDQDFMQQSRKKKSEKIMSTPIEKLFDLKQIEMEIPPKAVMLASIACGDCGEKTMESKTRNFAGKTLCLPCFIKANPPR